MILACHACGATLTHALCEMDPARWPEEATWRLHHDGNLVDDGVVLRWSNELWDDASRALPFPSEVWIACPDALLDDRSVVGPHGCCGWAPKGSERNQLCASCCELVGWHNSDCLMPGFVAFAVDAVDAR